VNNGVDVVGARATAEASWKIPTAQEALHTRNATDRIVEVAACRKWELAKLEKLGGRQEGQEAAGTGRAEGESRDAELLGDVGINPSATTQVTGGKRCSSSAPSLPSGFGLPADNREASRARYLTEPTSRSDLSSSGASPTERGLSSGRPSGMDRKRRRGEPATEAARPTRRRLWSVWRNVTWSPASTRAAAKGSFALMWPCAGIGNTSTCASPMAVERFLGWPAKVPIACSVPFRVPLIGRLFLK
jgi:hypothetical protein